MLSRARLALAVAAAVCGAAGAARTAPAATSAPAAPPAFAFLHGDWRLNRQENASVEQALATVAKKLGQNTLAPARVRPVLERLRQGLTEDGRQCGVASPGGDDELAALAAAGLCGKIPCRPSRARWSIECSEKWGACAVGLVFPPPAAPGREPGDDDEGGDRADRPQPERYSLRIPQAAARRWKSVDDLARALAATKRSDWKPVVEDDEMAGILGGLGMRGSDGGGLIEREPEQARAWLEVEREAAGTAPLWSLLREQPRNREERTIDLEIGRIPCLDHRRLESRTGVFARRHGRGFDVEIESHDADLRACLLPVVQQALAKEDKAIEMLNLSLELRRGDVLTGDGRYIVSLAMHHERTQDADWRKQKPRVSDPALEEWLLPRDSTPFKRCLRDFPFSDDYALRDYEKQIRLNFFYEVAFDASGRATSAKFLLPAKKGTPAEKIAEPARRCVEAAALRSLAPCSARGGTARAWMSATVARVKAGRPTTRPR
ncbi:MAG: hypothetical protein JXR83_15705 [Deltaproteobacteria bacterium]|nr:hypothetical protein [Deltaproteobacteria bacterium]